MAIKSGITTTLTVDNGAGTPVNISAYCTSVQVGTPTNLQDITTLDKAAVARLALLKDFTVQASGQYAPEVTAVFKNDTGVLRTTAVGLASGTETVTGEMLMADFQPYNRDQSGNATWSVTLQNGDGNVPVWT